MIRLATDNPTTATATAIAIARLGRELAEYAKNSAEPTPALSQNAHPALPGVELGATPEKTNG